MSLTQVRVGCAGWSIPAAQAEHFPPPGTHLERYARRFPAVEINSSFYRPHRPATYARWAAAVPDGFEFALKVPREITHLRRLNDVTGPLERFLAETSELGPKRGPLLVQLPPSLAYAGPPVAAFFQVLRERYEGPVVCEPRHPSWFTADADDLLAEMKVARVAADPAVVPTAAEPGGWGGLVYSRLHGSPQRYYSAYPAADLEGLARTLAATAASGVPTWCIFDNTALGAATSDGLVVLERLGAAEHP